MRPGRGKQLIYTRKKSFASEMFIGAQSSKWKMRGGRGGVENGKNSQIQHACREKNGALKQSKHSEKKDTRSMGKNTMAKRTKKRWLSTIEQLLQLPKKKQNDLTRNLLNLANLALHSQPQHKSNTRKCISCYNQKWYSIETFRERKTQSVRIWSIHSSKCRF